MSELIKSPITERAELQLAGVNKDIVLYTVLDQPGSDGNPGRDRKLKMENIEKYLFGFTNNRTVSELKYSDELYIIGDETPDKIKTKVSIDSITRFITGENDGTYVFDDDDTILISKKPTTVGEIGERILTSLYSLKEDIREDIRHFKTLEVGYDSVNEELKSNFIINEDGSFSVIGADNGNTSLSFSKSNGLLINKLQVGYNTSTDAFSNKFSVDIDGNILFSGNISNPNGILTIKNVIAEDLSGELTGNAATATKLKTARTIQGKVFDGTANIILFDQNLNTTDDVEFKTVNVSGLISAKSGLEFPLNRSGYLTNHDYPIIYSSGSTSGTYPFDHNGHMLIQTRSSSDSDILFLTGSTTPVIRMKISGTGDIEIENNLTVNGTITGSLTGNATSADKVNHSLTPGDYLNGSSFNGSVSRTFDVDATSSNTASKVVARDSSGNFSAGTITATLSGNASSATKLKTARTIQGKSFNGTANITLFDQNLNTTNNVEFKTINSRITNDGGISNNIFLFNDSSSVNTAASIKFGFTSSANAGFPNPATEGYYHAGIKGVRTNLGGSHASSIILQARRAISGEGDGYLTDLIEAGFNNTTPFIDLNGAVTIDGNLTVEHGITGSLTGNASSATKLKTARNINGVAFDGTSNISINLNNSLSAGDYLTGSSFNGSTARTWSVDATSSNTASKVVARDSSGNFSAGTITATLTGNASSATKLATARNINGVAFNGTSNISINLNNSLSAGSYLTGSSFNGSTARTWSVDATSSNTASKVVARDNLGNFSAGTITAELNGNAATANEVNHPLTPGDYIYGSSFNGSSNRTWSVDATSSNTAGKVVARDSSGNFSAGTITATLTGNASSATKLKTARTIQGKSFNGTANITLFDQNLNTTDDVEFKTITATLIECKDYLRFESTASDYLYSHNPPEIYGLEDSKLILHGAGYANANGDIELVTGKGLSASPRLIVKSDGTIEMTNNVYIRKSGGQYLFKADLDDGLVTIRNGLFIENLMPHLVGFGGHLQAMGYIKCGTDIESVYGGHLKGFKWETIELSGNQAPYHNGDPIPINGNTIILHGNGSYTLDTPLCGNGTIVITHCLHGPYNQDFFGVSIYDELSFWLYDDGWVHVGQLT